MKMITLEQVQVFHTKLINRTGGLDGVKDMGLVQSALERHKATFDGVDLYPSLIDKIAVTTVSLVRNHGFLDGNKRIGVSVMVLLMKLNNVEVQYTQNELIDLGLGLASNSMDEHHVIEWIKEHMV